MRKQLWLLRCGLVVACSALSSAQLVELGSARVPPPAELFARKPESIARFAAAATAWVDTTDRAAVAASYAQFSALATVPMEFTGSVVAGIPGHTAQAHKDAVLARINWFRRMAGVPDVTALDVELNRKAQLGALMLGANQQLSHTPPPTWTYYTAEGAEALSRSNVCTFRGINDPGCIALYIEDTGATNELVGHRRWLLFPKTQAMGTGDVTDATGRVWNANWVIIDGFWNQPRPQTRSEFVAWPPPGYVPYQVVSPRWSFSLASADFGAATVTMTRGGTAVLLRYERIESGYGDDTLVWVPDNLNANEMAKPVAPAADTPIQVRIDNVLVNGQVRSFTYTVIVFDPSVTRPPQLFLQHATTNAVAGWVMGGLNGTTIQYSPVIYTAAPGWRVAAAADFDSNGWSDLVLQNDATGQISIWYLGGAQGMTLLSAPLLYAAVPGWKIVAAGDFDRNSVPDLVFQNSTTGAVSFWYLAANGASRLSAPVVYTAASGWHVVGAGDFDRNGVPDLVLNDTASNAISFWYLGGANGSTLLAAPIVRTAAPGWKPVGASDLNGDLTGDLVFQNEATGAISVWYMGGATGSTLLSAPVIANAAANWKMTATK